VTFDGLRFDAQPKGEAIFVRQEDSTFEIQGLLTQAKPDETLPAVTTGVAIHGKSEDQPTIQVSMSNVAEPISEVVYSSGEFGEVAPDKEFFNSVFQGSSTGIIRRECGDCAGTHKDVYFKRKTSPSTFDAYEYMMVTWSDTDNRMHEDFDIYSTLEDALTDVNAWTFCNYNDYRHKIGFPRDCGPNGYVSWQWNSLQHGGTKKNIRYSVILEAESFGPTVVIDTPNGHSCPINLFVDCEIQESMSYNSNDKFHVTVENEGNLITVEYPGLVSVHIYVQLYGICHFSMDVNLLDCDDAEDTVRGLLGSPNGNWRDDWMDQEGNTYDIPSGAGAFFFEPAFDYTKQNWMVEDESDSIFCHNGDFEVPEQDYDDEIEKQIEDPPECCVFTCRGVTGDVTGCFIDCITLGCEAAEAFVEDPGNERPEPRDIELEFDDVVCVEEF